VWPVQHRTGYLLQEQLKRIPMFSDNFARYSSWKGEGALPQNDFNSLQKMIDKAHGEKDQVLECTG
jgi:hypothetical protein